VTFDDCEQRAASTLHSDCVACLAAREGDPVTATLALLRMLLVGDSTSESVQRDLCFEHRRRLGMHVGESR
jgi:hypothetical protein